MATYVRKEIVAKKNQEEMIIIPISIGEKV